MKKWEKEILQKQIQDETLVTNRIEVVYKNALKTIDDKIMVLQAKEQTQSVIYQLKYQQALREQVGDIYLKMYSTWYSDIDSYLKDCYEDSFYSTMYALHQEGIPVVIPFNQKEVAQAVSQDITTFSQTLSQKLYDNAKETAKKTIQQISKGIAMNSSYATISMEIAKTGSATVNQALRIVRTESHRIHEEVKFQTINRVKEEKGADIVKQWDSSIDKRTRPSHAALDGQLREIEQPFKSPTNGHTTMYPGGFGIAGEDINCRCVVLQRARWALDKSELDKYVGDLDGMADNQLQDLADKLGVSKDELIKKSNGVIESDGSINHRIKANNYNQFKKKYQKKEKLTAEQLKAQEEAQKIANLQNAVNDAQDKLNAIPNKKYSGIWKDDVSLSDYDLKKDAIPKKKDWYLQQISSSSDQAKIAQWQKYIDDLDEFEAEGSKYIAAKNKLKDLKNQLKALQPSSPSSFGSEAYSDARKKVAKNFSSRSSADKYHRPILDDGWDDLTDREKYGVWEYTHNSNPMNQPLSGYNDGWSRSRFVGVGNADWGLQDTWRSLGSNFKKFGENGHVTYREAIKDLTKAIDKYEFQDDMFLFRGSDNDGLAGLLESNIISFNDAKKLLDSGDISTLKQVLEGQSFQNHSFTSTGIASDAGFGSHSNVNYKIYAPKGTKGIYGEPQSYFGNTIYGEQLYTTGSSYYSVGSEAEIIVQRGTTFRITKIEKTGYNDYTVEMEVVEQPDYFKTGYEETFNNGATIHQK